MEHKFFSKALVKEVNRRNGEYDRPLDIPLEILMFGIGEGDRILHAGCCYSKCNLLNKLEEYNIPTFYLGVDVKDEIKEISKNYENVDNYSFAQQSIQEFIDEELDGYSGDNVFDYTILTGIFNKPIYEDNQYLFISTIIHRCMTFSDKVIFTLDTSDYNKYNYSVLYVINNVINMYDSVAVKKVKKHNYIFCITH
jgi:hypothetical protein